jgi:hypothetical protein
MTRLDVQVDVDAALANAAELGAAALASWQPQPMYGSAPIPPVLCVFE